MCSKIHNFYGKSCTHFSRQWITTKVPEHSDTCGRDGETLATNMPVHGAWGSAGVGTGSYTYRGQCVFFNSPNNHCTTMATMTAMTWAGMAIANGGCGRFDVSDDYRSSLQALGKKEGSGAQFQPRKIPFSATGIFPPFLAAPQKKKGKKAHYWGLARERVYESARAVAPSLRCAGAAGRGLAGDRVGG